MPSGVLREKLRRLQSLAKFHAGMHDSSMNSVVARIPAYLSLLFHGEREILAPFFGVVLLKVNGAQETGKKSITKRHRSSFWQV